MRARLRSENRDLAGAASRPAVWPRPIRGLGWMLVAVGVLVLLYLVYLMVFTNPSAGPDELRDVWEARVPANG